MKGIFIGIALIIAVSFSAVGQDYAAAAKEYCDCFKIAKDTMDTEFRELLIRVARQTDIKAAFNNEMKALDLDKQKRLGEQLVTLGAAMQSDQTESGRCGIALDAKYKKYNDSPEKEKDFTNKLAAQFRNNKDCEFLWAITVFALAFGDGE
jgi:hypothetical protein